MPLQPSASALLIVNPDSRKGAGATLQDGTERLQKAGIQVEQLDSGNPAESREAIESRGQYG